MNLGWVPNKGKKLLFFFLAGPHFNYYKKNHRFSWQIPAETHRSSCRSRFPPGRGRAHDTPCVPQREASWKAVEIGYQVENTYSKVLTEQQLHKSPFLHVAFSFWASVIPHPNNRALPSTSYSSSERHTESPQERESHSRHFRVCCKDYLRLEKYMSMYVYIQIHQQPTHQTQQLHFTPLYFMQNFSYYWQNIY